MQQLIDTNKIIFPPEGKGLPAYKRHKAEVRSDTKPYSSIIETQLNAMATKELREIFNGQIFDYPKTVNLVKQLVKQATSSDDIILDFFSGSATTAHAVMQLNAEDGGNRQFIMEQLPELCDEKSEAYKAGYRTIFDIGKARILKAGMKIKNEIEEQNRQLKIDEEPKSVPDIGFKVFKLDSSNFKVWDNSPIRQSEIPLLKERLSSMVDTIKRDRTDLDFVYEAMIKLGLPLTYKVKPFEIDGKRAYSVREDCLLIICVDKHITAELALKLAELCPARILFAEDSFDNMSEMSTAKLWLRKRDMKLYFV